jgi:hypothetical protein
MKQEFFSKRVGMPNGKIIAGMPAESQTAPPRGPLPPVIPAQAGIHPISRFRLKKDRWAQYLGARPKNIDFSSEPDMILPLKDLR